MKIKIDLDRGIFSLEFINIYLASIVPLRPTYRTPPKSITIGSVSYFWHKPLFFFRVDLSPSHINDVLVYVKKNLNFLPDYFKIYLFIQRILSDFRSNQNIQIDTFYENENKINRSSNLLSLTRMIKFYSSIFNL